MGGIALEQRLEIYGFDAETQPELRQHLALDGSKRRQQWCQARCRQATERLAELKQKPACWARDLGLAEARERPEHALQPAIGENGEALPHPLARIAGEIIA